MILVDNFCWGLNTNTFFNICDHMFTVLTTFHFIKLFLEINSTNNYFNFLKYISEFNLQDFIMDFSYLYCGGTVCLLPFCKCFVLFSVTP